MGTPLNFAFVSGLASLGIVVLAGGPAIGMLRRRQFLQPQRFDDCPESLQQLQQTKRGTPTMGGLLVLAAACTALLLGAGRAPEGLLVLGLVLGCGALGLADDLLKFGGANGRGLRSRPKFAASLALGALFGWISALWTPERMILDVPFGPELVLGPAGWIVFCMAVIASTTHAVNITDGMDGLATGCVAIIAVTFAVWVWLWEGAASPLLPWSCALAGACFGFLRFNAHPASVFLGDVGALGLGGAVAALGLLSGAGLWLILIGFAFVVEALSVIAQVASYRWRGGKRLFRVAPIHHHFHLEGLQEPRIVARFWILTFAGGSLATLLRLL